MKKLKEKDTYELREEAFNKAKSAKTGKEWIDAVNEYNRLDKILYNESTQIETTDKCEDLL